MKLIAIAAAVAGMVLHGVAAGKDKTLLEVGTEAPDFALPTEKGDTVTLSSFRGTSFVVLVFYPGDETPVCTKQLCELRDSWSGFADKGAKVFGVNPGNAASHQAFIAKNSFQFPLLIDADKATAKTYGTYAKFMQKRTVYVVDKEGKIAYAKRGKPPVSEILEAVK
jgi:peroxiredoxin Q/BCP